MCVYVLSLTRCSAVIDSADLEILNIASKYTNLAWLIWCLFLYHLLKTSTHLSLVSQ